MGRSEHNVTVGFRSHLNMKSPVFILGTQRSGTTLLTRALSAHPNIFIKNELQVQRIFTPGCSKSDILGSIKLQIEESYNTSIEQLFEKEKTQTWGLKDPELTNYIPLLEQFIPESKFIIIVRDGRGVVNSYKHNKWGLGTTAYTGALRWQREVDEQLDFMKRYPESVILLRYEDLVTNMEECLKKACAHIGESFLPEMLNYHKESKFIRETRENVHTNKKPDIELSKKWRNELTTHEIDIIETVTKDLLQKLEYTLIGEQVKLGKLEILYYKLHQLIIGEFQLQYRWRRSQFKAKFKKAKSK